MKLHDWIYEIVEDICYDREYVYPYFVRHFTGLMKEIEEQGSISGEGTYSIPGIKSGVTATLHWQIEHRLNWVGSNVVSIQCEFGLTTADLSERAAKFEMTSGEMMD